ncbi:MAG: sulfite exporter TauE/SafE family protein [Oscillospiraceae bacterium]|nr:sulfite exporter TauE/SafE family protein [Oscillospiraceae bacterium]
MTETRERISRKKKRSYLAGAVCGLLNGLFGSGGGVVAVLFLREITGDEQRAHASATLAMLCMSLVSLLFYSLGGFIDWREGFMFVPGGLLGAVAGSLLLKSIKTEKLKKLFGAVLCISGGVMLFS